MGVIFAYLLSLTLNRLHFAFLWKITAVYTQVTVNANVLLVFSIYAGLILHEENIGLINNYKEQLDQSPEQWKYCNITLKGRKKQCCKCM